MYSNRFFFNSFEKQNLISHAQQYIDFIMIVKIISEDYVKDNSLLVSKTVSFNMLRRLSNSVELL